ncbi:regulatory protein RecX [Dictyobacter aurantiacus]|uniref:Regulatory protein RecX n=1 Tax=Dictyobacter aurantiacus TaxID=1936993 RepID=A0A401ZDK0_9CHLR|nr:RecX family transcriptional regulator [Dictyobacter aurantiacus]GCE04906.1 regulatory protein RecX [Dictyobacter aurantiacus]
MRITGLQPQANNPDRTSIFVDEHFLMGVNTLIVLKMGLRLGQELTPAQVQQLEEEEALQKAVDRAMNYLSFRPRSREEVRRYLKQKQTPPELVDAVIERLNQLDLINDESFASFWIESRERFRPKGAQAIKNELKMKGVKREVIDEVVTGEQDEELALRAGRKKALSLLRQPNMDYNAFRTKLGPFLQRRGFSYEVTKRVVQQLWEESSQEPVEDDEDFSS